MKKLILAICLIITCSTVSLAGCEVITTANWWFDVDRFEEVLIMFKLSEQRATPLVLDDLKTGKAVIIEKGTKIDTFIINPETKEFCRIWVKDKMLLNGFSKNVRCK